MPAMIDPAQMTRLVDREKRECPYDAEEERPRLARSVFREGGRGLIEEIGKNRVDADFKREGDVPLDGVPRGFRSRHYLHAPEKASRLMNCPRPVFPRQEPLSTITSPRDRTVSAFPLTLNPSNME